MSMALILGLAIKSALVAAAALLFLRLARRRSAADRSAIAHGGLAALLLLPLGALLLPPLEIESGILSAAAPEPGTVALPPSASEVAPSSASFPAVDAGAAAVQPLDWGLLLYALPALLLLLLTLAALLRLWPLKSRAQVIVDPHWLTALARAQRRMGMKSGTALLVSDDLHSPISWGLMRPVILLNDEALVARDEAEAIIAHELAHVSRFDWLKLLLARVATALYWFNPLVWLLAREAHQLREEAADDAVLAANVENTDYAQLLVGIARHECRGLLIGAHGVAPGRDSLKRRVKRVLDTTLSRTPASRPWLAGFACGAFAAATPLAALTLVPTDMKEPPQMVGRPAGAAVAARATAAGPAPAPVTAPASPPVDGTIALAPAPPLPPTAPQPPQPARGIDLGHLDIDHDEDVDVDIDDPVDGLIAMKAVGVTPAYAAAIARAAPQLGKVDVGTLTAFKAAGVTPEYLQARRALGFGRVSGSQVVAATVNDVDADYIRAMQAQGVRASLGQLIEMRVVGVTPAYVASLRRRGLTNLTPKQLVSSHLAGLGPEDIPRRH